MVTKNGRLRCDECDKFMSWKEPFYIWTPFGSYFDYEPPEPKHAHKECYETLEENSRIILITTSWIKPQLFNGREDEHQR